MSNKKITAKNLVTSFKQNKRKNALQACSTCRKRKIKCSGIYPCSSCVIYSSQCDLLNTDGLLIVNGIDNRVQKKIVTPIGRKPQINLLNFPSTNNDIDKVISPISVDNNNENEKIKDPDFLTSSFGKVGDNSDFRNNKTKLPNIAKHLKHKNFEITTIINNEKTFQAKSAEDNNFTQNLYRDSIEEDPKYKQLKYTLDYLKSSPIQNDEIKRFIESTLCQLDQYIDVWEPKIDFVKMSNSTDNRSIETQLLTNKYNSKIYLTEIAFYEANDSTTIFNDKYNKKNTDTSNKRVITDRFGLYCPYETFSLRGFDFLLHKYTVDGELSIEVNGLIKMTFWILLKYFNLQCCNYGEIINELTDPLQAYLHNNPEIITAYIANDNTKTLNDFSSTEDLTELSDKQCLRIIIINLPQPFTQNVTGLATEQLMKLLDNKLDLYKKLMESLQTCLKKLQTLLQLITHKGCKIEDINTQSSLKTFKTLCKVYDTLLSLCHHHLNFLSNRQKTLQSLEYLELFSRFVKYMDHSVQNYTSEKILGIALKIAMKLGITRWEYYIGMDEVQAEKYRRIWWTLFSREVILMIGYKNGESMIEMDKISCLLPNPFRKLGFLNHEEYLANIENSVINDKLKSFSFNELLFYGNISLTIVLGDFYSNVLYNKRFTNIKNVQKPPYIKEKYMVEIFRHTKDLKNKFDILESQLSNIFNYDRSECTRNSKSSDKLFLANKFLVLFYTHKAISLAAVSSLIHRQNTVSRSTLFTEKMTEYSNDIYDCWRKVLQIALSLQTGFEVWFILKRTLLIQFYIASKLVSDHKVLVFDDIVTQLRVFSRLILLNRNIITTLDDETYKSRIINHITPYFTIFAILIRLTLIDYMHKNGLNETEVCKLIGQKNSDLVYLAECILNHNSYIYTFILRSIPETIFELNIKQLISSQYAKPSKDIGKASSKIQNSQRSSESTIDNPESKSSGFKDSKSSREMFVKFVNNYISTLALDPNNEKKGPEMIENLKLSSSTEFKGNVYDFFNDIPFEKGLEELYDLFWNNSPHSGM